MVPEEIGDLAGVGRFGKTSGFKMPNGVASCPFRGFGSFEKDPKMPKSGDFIEDSGTIYNLRCFYKI